MGTSTSVYIGAFLRIPCFQRIEPAQQAGCSRRCGAEVPAGSRFCPACGARAQGPQPERTRLVKPRPYDLDDEAADSLFWTPEYIDAGPDSTLWLPNERGTGTVVSADGGSATVSLRELDAAALQSRYAREWALVIERIRERFGVTAEVDVGVVVYSH